MGRLAEQRCREAQTEYQKEKTEADTWLTSRLAQLEEWRLAAIAQHESELSVAKKLYEERTRGRHR